MRQLRRIGVPRYGRPLLHGKKNNIRHFRVPFCCEKTFLKYLLNSDIVIRTNCICILGNHYHNVWPCETCQLYFSRVPASRATGQRSKLFFFCFVFLTRVDSRHLSDLVFLSSAHARPGPARPCRPLVLARLVPMTSLRGAAWRVGRAICRRAQAQLRGVKELVCYVLGAPRARRPRTHHIRVLTGGQV